MNLINTETDTTIVKQTDLTARKYAPGIKGAALGIVSAFVCLLLFSLIESFLKTILYLGDYSFISTVKILFPMVIIYGGVFALLPSMAGGYILEIAIRNQDKNGVSSMKKAIILGVTISGLAIIIITGIGMIAAMILPHAGWQVIIRDILNDRFWTNAPGYISELIAFGMHLFPELLTVDILACISGGYTGYLLAKEFQTSSAIV